jgi:hypothetical protein
MKRTITAMTTGGDKKSFKEEKGYSRAGGLLKSKATKSDLEKKQTRLNAFSAEQNKQVGDTVRRNVDAPGAIKDGAELNDAGMYKGDQKYRKMKKIRTPRYRHGS